MRRRVTITYIAPPPFGELVSRPLSPDVAFVAIMALLSYNCVIDKITLLPEGE